MVALAARAKFCAICIRDTGRLALRCLEPGGQLYSVCEDCDSEASEPIRLPKPPGRKYAMHESALAILRAAHRFDWISSGNLRESLGIPNWIEDRKRYDRFTAMMCRMTRSGYLRSRQREFLEYQITELGGIAIGIGVTP